MSGFWRRKKRKRRFRFATFVQSLQQCKVLGRSYCGTSTCTLCQALCSALLVFLAVVCLLISFVSFSEQDEEAENAESAGVFKFIVYDFKWLWWWWWSLCVIWHKYMFVLYLNCHKSVDPYLWTVLSSSSSSICDFRNCLSVCGTGVYFHFV